MMLTGFPFDDMNAGANAVTVDNRTMRIMLQIISAGFENMPISFSNIADALSWIINATAIPMAKAIGQML